MRERLLPPGNDGGLYAPPMRQAQRAPVKAKPAPEQLKDQDAVGQQPVGLQAPVANAPDAQAAAAKEAEADKSPKPPPRFPPKEIEIKTSEYGQQTFQAELDPEKCQLTIRKRIQFWFKTPDDAGQGSAHLWDHWEKDTSWADTPDKIAWRDKYIDRVQKDWSDKHVLTLDGDGKDAPCKAVNVRLVVVPVEHNGNPHSIVDVFKNKAGRSESHLREKVTGRDVTLQSSSADPLQRPEHVGGYQIPASHEMGHMLGVAHAGKRAGQRAEYGDPGTAEERDIMGDGMTVSPQDYEPFAYAMQQITNRAWRVGTATTGVSWAGVAALLGGGALAGLGIGGLAALASPATIALGAALGWGGLIGLGVGAIAAVIYAATR